MFNVLFLAANFGFLLFVSMGIGRLFDFRKAESSVTRIVVGFYSIPVFIVILNNLNQNNLRNSFLLVVAAAVIGFCYLLKNKEISPDLKASHLKAYWPFLAFIIITTLCYIVVLTQTNFGPRFWDEFSHWLTDPAKYVKFNAFYSDKFIHNAYLNYNPGLPVTNIFFSIVFLKNNLDLDSYIFSYQFHLFIFLISMLFIFRKMLSERLLNHLFLICGLKWMSDYLIPSSSLIECAQFLNLGIFFGFFYKYWVDVKDDSKVAFPWMILGTSAIFAFLLKSGSLFMVPMLIVFVLFTKQSVRVKFMGISTLVLALLIVKFSWTLYLNQNGLVPVTMQPELLALLKKRYILLDDFVISFFKKEKIYIDLVLFLIACKYATIKARAATLSFIGIYLLGLLSIYLFVMGDYEAMMLASHHRYLSLVTFVMNFFAVFHFMHAFADLKIENKKLSFLKNPIVVLVCLVYVAGSFQKSIYSKLTSNEAPIYVNLLSSIRKMDQFVAANYPQARQVLVIEQGSNEQAANVYQFAKIFFLSNLQLSLGHTSFGLESDNVWRQVFKENKFTELAQNQDVLLVLKSDLWLDEILKKNFCIHDQLPFLVIKRVQGKYECIAI